MSLTSFLKLKDVNEKFKTEFATPAFNKGLEILAPPLTANYSTVGTAFDYLLRFYLQQLNPKAKTSEWVAENPVLGDEIQIGRKNFSLEKFIAKAKKHHAEFLETGKITEELIESVLSLAQIEGLYRSGRYEDEMLLNKLGVIDPQDVKDLRHLIKVVQPKFFRAKKLCILNPTFGRASELVCGADCDLIIDDTLIEIKTIKNLELDRSHYNQLLGYYILSTIGKIAGTPSGYSIKKLGIYFSRFGHLWLIDVAKITDQKKLTPFLKWFEKRARQEF
jgi:hypothetical protein